MGISEFIKTDDWKNEKHVPVIEAPGQVRADETVEISVSVGKEIPHPNTAEHHIVWTKLFFMAEDSLFPIEVGDYTFSAHSHPDQGTVAAEAEPTLTAAVRFISSGRLMALSYCNLHGLWQSEREITVS